MWQDRGPISLGGRPGDNVNNPLAQVSQSLKSTRPSSQPKKGFWTDQLSTGGGIAGSLAGAAGGAAIGSVVPVVGTAIGGLLGAILGGSAGSGAGELAENVITGEKDVLKNVGQEALLGGAFAAPPIRAARAIGGAGKALVTGAGGQAARTAAETALTRPGLLSRTIGQSGQRLAGVTDDLAVKQFRLSPSQTSNFKKKFGEDAGKTINRYGFATADDISVKGINPLQEQFTQLTQNIGQVSRDDVARAFDTKIATLKKSAVQDNKNLANALESQKQTVLQQFGQNAVVDGTTLNAIRREFDSLVNYTQQAANPARYNVNKRSADAIREVLQKSDPTGTLKNVGQELSKLRQLQDIALKQDELGRGSLPANLTGLLGAGVAGGATANPIGAAAGFAATKAINSQAGRRALNQGAESLSSRLSQLGQGTVNTMSLPRVAGRQFGADLVSTGFDALQGEGQPTLGNINQSSLGISNPMATNTAQSMNVPMAANMGQSYTNQPQNASPYGRDNLLYDIQRDPANADQYINYYQTLEQVFGASAIEQPELSQSNQSALASADNAENTLNQLEDLFNSAGGGSGRVGGFIQNIAGSAGFDKNASVYNSLSQASVTQIAKALAGSGAGTVSDADARVIIQALPTLQDSPEEAQAKFNALRQRLNAARENVMFYGQGGTAPTSLEQALMQQGGF